ncbi:LysR family transcriptional regulator [Ferrimonas balearica]|uniref:LysR family transcriptional regulator n=1 Tax=Ferrimonas balearica TaxID=44012 RepID=UPI001C9A2437|nr:LysR family transcriptional regulator [Ferrimonas balearica]MBY5920236.1 LysR family transcriptional regulator [Ferrimonas balearica]MBY5997079.1 LysR family transcriptional regulator [Ferrimonas balearica]
MKALQDLDIVVLTARLGSLSAAARQLDLTPAATSAALKRVENELGVALFVRSTRSLKLTDEGERFLSHCSEALALLKSGAEAVRSNQSQFAGPLRLSLPSDLGRRTLLPWLDQFLEQHPQLTLQLQLSDRLSDLYQTGSDLSLRYGEPEDSNLVALPLAPNNRRVLVASPAYIGRYGEPDHPARLSDHNCLCFHLDAYRHDRWAFSRNGESLTVKVKGDRSADDGEAVHRWALAGQGIAYKSRLDVADDLAAGRLNVVCSDWMGEAAPLNLICADRRQLSARIQSLRAFLAERCEQQLARSYRHER